MISLRGLDLEVRPYAEHAHAWADYYGIPTTVTSGYRTWTKQQQLRDNYERCLAEGRFPSAPDCRFPANRPGDSAHNYGFAWDSWVSPNNRDAWRTIREWVGFRVPANDWIHAEVPGWRRAVR